MGSSKTAKRKRRRAYRAKHPICQHVFGKWQYGEVICNLCGKGYSTEGKIVYGKTISRREIIVIDIGKKGKHV